MNLSPTGLGVEPFLRALQASTDAAAASGAAAAPMETDESKEPKPEDKMDEA